MMVISGSCEAAALQKEIQIQSEKRKALRKLAIACSAEGDHASAERYAAESAEAYEDELSAVLELQKTVNDLMKDQMTGRKDVQ